MGLPKLEYIDIDGNRKFLEGVWHTLKNEGYGDVMDEIAEHLGFFPCAECHIRLPDDLLTGKKITHKATLDTPEEYENICEDCVALQEAD